MLARAQLRAEEIASSVSLLIQVLNTLPDSPIQVDLPPVLPPGAMGVGLVEAWCGELLDWVTTGADGTIARYAIKDPSFNNWTGLAIAIRGNLVADFPAVRSNLFNLSYRRCLVPFYPFSIYRFCLIYQVTGWVGLRPH